MEAGAEGSAAYFIPGLSCEAEAPPLELGVGRGGLVGIGGGRPFWVVDPFGYEQWQVDMPPECAGEEAVCGPSEVPSRARLIGRLSLPAEVDAERVHAGFLRLELDTAGRRPPEFLAEVASGPPNYGNSKRRELRGAQLAVGDRLRGRVEQSPLLTKLGLRTSGRECGASLVTW